MFGRKKTRPPLPTCAVAHDDVLAGRRLEGRAVGKPNLVDRFQDRIDFRAYDLLETALPLGVVARFHIGREKFIAAVGLDSTSDAADILMVHRSDDDAMTARMLKAANFTDDDQTA